MGGIFGGGGGGSTPFVPQAPSQQQVQQQSDSAATSAAQQEINARGKVGGGIYSLYANPNGAMGYPPLGGDFFEGRNKTQTLGGPQTLGGS
jgi:hypothetical protein